MHVDYLISGQGLAGSLFGWNALIKGKSIRIYDEYSGHSSTRIAAGVVNPITGKNLKLTWKSSELIPYARRYYQEIEEELGVHIIHDLPIYKVLKDAKSRNDWDALSAEPGYMQYVGQTINPDNIHVRAPGGLGVINNSYWVDTVILMDALRQYFIKKEVLVENMLDYSKIKLDNHCVQYDDISAKYLVCSEGHLIINNPFFCHLPIIFAKGEVLTIETEDILPQAILNNNGYLVPLGNNRYKAGATYEWKDRDQGITISGRISLQEKISGMADINYRILTQEAGLRPASQDRRPILGKHPEYPEIVVFNGLGTKGILLAPYFSTHLFDSIENDTPLLSEVDVRRFFQ